MPILLVLILLAVLGLFWPILVAAVVLFPVGVALLWEVVKEHPIASVVCGILLICMAIAGGSTTSAAI